MTLGAAGEGMVAGDAVNTAARVQAAAEPGQVLVDGATQRLAGARGRVRRRRGACAEGQGGAGAAVAGDAGAGRGGRVAAGGRAGGAADRPGRGAAHDPGAVPRGGGAAGAAAGAGVRPGGGGQVPAGLGVRQVRRRAGGSRCGGTGAGACPTGRGWRSGRWPRSSGSGWASPRKTPPRPRRPSWPRAWTGSSPIMAERAYAGARLGRLLGVAAGRG